MPGDTATEPPRTVAALRRELARAQAERDEALAREAAMAEVLAVINASPGDLAPVFDAILEKATRLCDAGFGTLLIYDGEHFANVAVHNVPEAFAEFANRERSISFGPGTAPYRLLAGEPFVHIIDGQVEEVYRRGDPAVRALIDLAGARTWVAVALRKDGVLLGAITVFRQEVRPFSDREIALVQNFAAQAVIAMESARLMTETREALEQQTATAEVLGVINASPGDLAPVFDAMLEKATRLCDATYGHLFTFDGEYLHTAAVHGDAAFVDWLKQRGPIPLRGGPVSRAMHGELVVATPDFTADEAYRAIPFLRDLVDRAGVRSSAAIALRKDGTPLGAFVLYRTEVRPFTDKQIALLQNFAAQAVIAMENARLLTETREALEQQTATAEVLGVINSSPGDLTPVFDAMLERARRLCEAEVGTLWTFDGEQFWPAVALDPEVRERRIGRRPAPRESLGRIERGEDIVHVLDVTVEPGYLDDPEVEARTKAVGTRSVLSVALRKDSRLLGAITTGRRSVRAYSDKQVSLLQNFAAQAVIAMENARLLGELRQRNDEIAGWNRELEDRVAAQLGELERVGKLKRFLAPQLAELIVARGDEAVLETHRRDIVVVFCDLRDFTAFAETAEPEEVLDLLREYHAALGPIVSASEGTLDHFSGDGIMVFFNDPVPVADASERAVRMAIEMRAAMVGLQAQWRRQGRRIGFGAGIARGYATLGQIGFADRIDYTAIGTVCNLAARLCAEAKDGQILISQRVAAAVEDAMPLEAIGEVALKGLREPIAVYNVPP